MPLEHAKRVGAEPRREGVRVPAAPRAGVWLRGGHGDGEPELFELGDEAAGLAFGVLATGPPAGAPARPSPAAQPDPMPVASCPSQPHFIE